MREHPAGVNVPVGLCTVCGKESFLDGTPNDLRVRPHWIQDEAMRKKMVAQAIANGRRLYEFPNCIGSGKRAVADSVTFPLVWYCRTP